MKFDIGHQLGATTRFVGMREHEGRPARVIVATRTYDTTIEDLWDAITTAERIPRWFLPIEGDLRLHGRYQLKGNADGEITGCEPPTRLALTREFGGDVSWVKVELTKEHSGGTHLQLEHVAYVDDDRWEEFGPGAAGVGWELALAGLDHHIATGASVDPAEAERWSMSEEGKAFMRSSSEGWAEASIAAGSEPGAARAAAARTTAFYTGEGGEPPPEA